MPKLLSKLYINNNTIHALTFSTSDVTMHKCFHFETNRQIGKVMLNLLHVVCWEPMLPFAAVVASPPPCVRFVDVGDDRVLTERKLVVLARSVVVQCLYCNLNMVLQRSIILQVTHPYFASCSTTLLLLLCVSFHYLHFTYEHQFFNNYNPQNPNQLSKS